MMTHQQEGLQGWLGRAPAGALSSYELPSTRNTHNAAHYRRCSAGRCCKQQRASSSPGGCSGALEHQLLTARGTGPGLQTIRPPPPLRAQRVNKPEPCHVFHSTHSLILRSSAPAPAAEASAPAA
jgi:hypothetical protein